MLLCKDTWISAALEKTTLWKADMVCYKLKNRAKEGNPISVVAFRVG